MIMDYKNVDTSTGIIIIVIFFLVGRVNRVMTKFISKAGFCTLQSLHTVIL